MLPVKILFELLIQTLHFLGSCFPNKFWPVQVMDVLELPMQVSLFVVGCAAIGKQLQNLGKQALNLHTVMAYCIYLELLPLENFAINDVVFFYLQMQVLFML